MSNIKRWSDAKLDKELHFARSCRDDNHPENLAWLARLTEESDQRYADKLASSKSARWGAK